MSESGCKSNIYLKEMDRRYGRRRSREEEYYSKNDSITMTNSYPVNSRNSSKEKKTATTEQVKQPIRTLGDWSEFLSSSGKIYFYNQKTEKTQWEKPEEWDWLISEEKKQAEKGYYSKDYKNSVSIDNRYRSKYDHFDSPNNSKSMRYNENYKNTYQRDYPSNDYNNTSSNYNQSFRQNSYNNSYNNNMYEHNRMYQGNNMQSSGGMQSGYDNNYNNNYRNYGTSFNNDQRMSNPKNNTNFNRDEGPNKIYQSYSKQHTSRYENYNENDRYPPNNLYNNNPMYNNNPGNNYYNNNNNNYPPNDYEMRDGKYGKNSQNRSENLNQQSQEKNYPDGYSNSAVNNSSSSSNNFANNNNHPSRSNSRSKSSSNLSRSRSRSSSRYKSRSSSNSSNSSHSKSKTKSHKRLKKSEPCGSNSKSFSHSEQKNNSQRLSETKTYSNSPSGHHYQHYSNQRNGESFNSGNAKFRQNSTDESRNMDVDYKGNQNENFKNGNDHSTNESKQNGTDKPKDSDKHFEEHVKSSPSSTARKDMKAEPTYNETKPESSSDTAQNGLTGEEASVKFEAVNLLIDPVLSSTVEDINKFYKPELLYRMNGIDLNENVHGINSQVILKQINSTAMGAELKKFRAIVRFQEIKKTLQEQRLIFLQNQMKEIEELLN